jgi:hypothetical protein
MLEDSSGVDNVGISIGWITMAVPSSLHTPLKACIDQEVVLDYEETRTRRRLAGKQIHSTHVCLGGFRRCLLDSPWRRRVKYRERRQRTVPTVLNISSAKTDFLSWAVYANVTGYRVRGQNQRKDTVGPPVQKNVFEPRSVAITITITLTITITAHHYTLSPPQR